MQITALAEKYKQARINAFEWRNSLDVTKKIALALSFALITGLLAQVKIALPMTPVPVTGQTLAVLLAGVLLGRNWGGVSMALYAGIGAIGMPWFSGFAGGAAVLTGPTGGYIFGFILTALFLGHVTDKYVKSRNFWPMATLMSFATLFLIFLPGMIQLGVWLNMIKGTPASLNEIMMMGFAPFVIGAAIKVGIAAAIAKGVTPKQ